MRGIDIALDTPPKSRHFLQISANFNLLPAPKLPISGGLQTPLITRPPYNYRRESRLGQQRYHLKMTHRIKRGKTTITGWNFSQRVCILRPSLHLSPNTISCIFGLSPSSSQSVGSFWMPPSLTTIQLIAKYLEFDQSNRPSVSRNSLNQNISFSLPLVSLSSVMHPCVNAYHPSMNCLSCLHFIRMHFVTVIQALNSTNRIDMVTMDTDQTAVYVQSSF